MSSPRNPGPRRESQRVRRRSAGGGGRQADPAPQAAVAEPPVIAPEHNALLTTPRIVLGLAVLALLAVFVWSYWTTFVSLMQIWDNEPDYSHGYFVVPLAIYFLWARRSQFPGVAHKHWIWPGIVLLGIGAAMRYVAALYYLEPVDGWSLLFWVAGVVWLLGGWRWLRWALPSIVFLLFMVQLPYRVERMLSYPLQRIATIISGWTLQCFGLPAVTQGNTILLGSHTLEVEQACSGLTIFIGIAALAFAYVVLVRRSWWEKALLIVAVLPISLIANSARIVLTGLLTEFASDAVAKKFSHDLAGWLMLPFAALLFALVLWYLGWLFPQAQQLDVRGMIREQGLRSPSRPSVN